VTTLNLDHTFSLAPNQGQRSYQEVQYVTNPPLVQTVRPQYVQTPPPQQNYQQYVQTPPPQQNYQQNFQTAPPQQNYQQHETASPSTQEPFWTQPRPTRPQIVQTAPPAQQNYERIENFECGITEYQAPSTTGLVIGGHNAVRGQFPW
jgi:hypothetical protein